jgi:hypothetical protein
MRHGGARLVVYDDLLGHQHPNWVWVAPDVSPCRAD